MKTRSISISSAAEGIENVRFHINDIPVEILSCIFSSLALADRKQVKLTCKLWHEGCNRLAILKNEKFVFRSGYSIQEITESLLARRYIHLNLEFQGLPVDTFPASIWKSCGARIASIRLFECTVNDKVMKNVIRYCSNLRDLLIEKTSCYAKPAISISEIFCSPEGLDKLIHAKVQRKKLQTFQISTGGHKIPGSIHEKIFRLFPCIRSFSAGTPSFKDLLFIPFFEDEYHPGYYFSRIDKYLPATIEELVFNVPSDCSWSKTLSDVSDIFKLKKLETIYAYSTRNYNNFLRFLGSQTELKVIRISVIDTPDDKVKDMLFYILKNCRKLKEFRYNFQPVHLHLNPDETTKFFQLVSNLEFLELCYDFFPDEYVTSSLPPAKNLLLQTLKMECDTMSEDCYLAILRYCAKLRSLALARVSDSILQEIFKSHTQLQTLILWQIDDCTDFGFTGISEPSSETAIVSNGYSISRLNQLMHLEIDGLCTESLTVNSLYEFKFPILEYFRLSVNIFSDLPKEALQIFALNLPSLKVMLFDEMYLSYDDLLTFCKNAKNLYRLVFDRINGKCESINTEFFEACPSLRFISDYISIQSYNPLRKKALFQRPERLEFLNKDLSNEKTYHCIHVL